MPVWAACVAKRMKIGVGGKECYSCWSCASFRIYFTRVQTMPRPRIAMATRLLGYLGLALVSGSAIAQQYSVVKLSAPYTGEGIYPIAMNGRGAITGLAAFPNAKPG